MKQIKSKKRYTRLTKRNKEANKMIEDGYEVKLINGYIVGTKPEPVKLGEIFNRIRRIY